MSAATTILFCVALPLVAAAPIAALGRSPNLREALTLATAAALFLSVATLVPAVAAGERPAAVLLTMLPGLAIAFRVEPLGMTFAMIASFLWFVTSLYSVGYMRGHGEKRQSRFYAYFAIALGSTMGVALAGNMLTLFVFYEILTLSTIPLVTHHGTDKARRAGRVYLGILLGTSIGLQLLAVIWTWREAGTLDFTAGGILGGRADDATVAILLVLYVFGIGKAAVMPFHRWLPAAMVAPTPVSALLHAVAVVKAGVFTVLKVAIYIFGIDTLAGTVTSDWLAYAAAATILIASLVAMTKDNLKARLAYSTISQLSYVVLGALLASGIGAVGGAMHIAMHAFGKITLFFCAGAILVASHKTEVSQMRGLGRAMPITFTAFLVASLSIIGLPPMGGLWGKWYLALGAVEAGQLMLVAVLMVSSLLNVAYLVPVAIRAFLSPAEAPDDDHHHNHHEPYLDTPTMQPWSPVPGMREAPWPCVAALVLTACGCLVLFFQADALFAFLSPLAGDSLP